MRSFRMFFDASARQHACKYYAERPVLAPQDVAVLRLVEGEWTAHGRYARFGFFSEENRRCEAMSGRFVDQERNHDPRSGDRLWSLTAVGREELKRATEDGSQTSVPRDGEGISEGDMPTEPKAIPTTNEASQ